MSFVSHSSKLSNLGEGCGNPGFVASWTEVWVPGGAIMYTWRLRATLWD